MLQLNDRLSLCASFVTRGGVAVDVGTDHAYLASFLVLNNICNKVIACDINEKPLLSAKKTLEKYKLQDRVILLQSDGLKNVPDENVTDVIVAGMGGELISQIIGNADWLKRGTNIILQAMTRASFLRKWLYSNGFKIVEEKAVEDDNLLYTVIKAEYCGEISEVDDFFSETGMLDFSEEISQKYLSRQANRLKTISNELLKAEDKKDMAEKYFNLSQKILTKMGE